MTKYLISACLLGENCKYNGGSNYQQSLVQFLKDKEFCSVCPEMMGGLPTPRPCCEIQNGRVMNENGQDVSEAFQKGAYLAEQRAVEFQTDLAILQPRSPSCGCGKIYSGNFDGTLVNGVGWFAQRLLNQGIPCITVEEFIQSLEETEKK